MSAPKLPSRTVEQAETITEGAVIERTSRDLLEDIAEHTAAQHTLALPSGRRVVADASEAGDRLRIESPTGEVELQITLTESGPLLTFRAADLQLGSTGAVQVDCERFEVRAKEEIVHESGGHLKERVQGDRVSLVRGTNAAYARETHIESKRGDVKVVANDDVQLLGERIKLNC